MPEPHTHDPDTGHTQYTVDQIPGSVPGTAAAATTLGTVVKKIEVFDAAGTSLGFLPVYDAIT